jgi:hypothetical protein
MDVSRKCGMMLLPQHSGIAGLMQCFSIHGDPGYCLMGSVTDSISKTVCRILPFFILPIVLLSHHAYEQ